MTQGGVTVNALPVVVTAGQINAIMPPNAPLGRVSIYVTFGGSGQRAYGTRTRRPRSEE